MTESTFKQCRARLQGENGGRLSLALQRGHPAGAVAGGGHAAGVLVDLGGIICPGLDPQAALKVYGQELSRNNSFTPSWVSGGGIHEK